MRLCLRIMFCLTVALAAPQTTIRVPVQMVSLRALVFSGDRLVPDLPPDAVRVLDNGHPQSITIEPESAPLSIAILIQASQDVRRYLPFISGVASTLDALLVGETGESAAITYNHDIRTIKSFDRGDLRSSLKAITPDGSQARLFDAAGRAIALLAARTRARHRVLLCIGQPADIGSESDLAMLRQSVDKEDVTVYTMALPLVGKSFVADNFSLNGVSRAEKGGFRAAADLKKLLSVFAQNRSAASASDPFSVLTAATGGAQFHLRTQRQLEDAIATVGLLLRSGFAITYYPTPADAGYHALQIEVALPGAKVYSRPGYWLTP